jgi:hypothetical protein
VVFVRRLSQLRTEILPRRGGRKRDVSTTAARIRAAFGSAQLPARPGVIPAYTASASALLAVLTAMAAQTEVLAGEEVEQGLASAEFGEDLGRDAHVQHLGRRQSAGVTPGTMARVRRVALDVGRIHAVPPVGTSSARPRDGWLTTGVPRKRSKEFRDAVSEWG